MESSFEIVLNTLGAEFSDVLDVSKLTRIILRLSMAAFWGTAWLRAGAEREIGRFSNAHAGR